MVSRRDRRARRHALLVGVVAAAVVLGASVVAATAPRDRGGAAETPVTVYAAGDLGGSASEVAPVASLMRQDPELDRALLLGDICYPNGAPDCYPKVLDSTYGPIRSKVIVVPGNHDYHTTNGSGFFGYYPDTIPRAFDLANGWTVITVNTEVSHGAGSAMEQGVKSLANDAKARGRHVIAITHHPRYTACSSHSDDSALAAIVSDLEAAKADLFLAGHNHCYERFKLQPGSGITFFTAGTGGNGLYSCKTDARHAYCDGTHHGALRLRLFSDHYDWAFVPTSGAAFDAGSAPTRTGGVIPSTTSSSSSTSSSTSSSSSSTSSSTSSTSTTTLPGQCADHSGSVVFTSSQYLHLLYLGCWSGGVAWDTDSWLSTPWETFHHSGAWNLRGPATVKNTAAVNFGDSYRAECGTSGFVFDSVRGLFGHDDAVEADCNTSGTVKNSIFTSFVIFSAQGGSTNGNANTVTLDGNYFELFPTPTVYKGPDTTYNKYPAPGTGGFFKTDQNSPGFVIRNNVFVASVLPNHQTLGPPAIVRACSGNTIVWKNATVPFPLADAVAWLKKCPDTVFKGA